MAVFCDLNQSDFPCPEHRPWILGGVISKPVQVARSEPDFSQVAQDIRAAPEEGLWITLKEELRLVEAFLALHEGRSPCWKRRQMARLVGFYHAAKAKSGV